MFAISNQNFVCMTHSLHLLNFTTLDLLTTIINQREKEKGFSTPLNKDL